MSQYNFKDYEGDDICPPWWPQILWDLHRKLPWQKGTGNPPNNYPPATNEILNALLIHTSSYYITDEKTARDVRNNTVNTIVKMAQTMDALHDEAMKGR